MKVPGSKTRLESFHHRLAGDLDMLPQQLGAGLSVAGERSFEHGVMLCAEKGLNIARRSDESPIAIELVVEHGNEAPRPFRRTGCDNGRVKLPVPAFPFPYAIDIGVGLAGHGRCGRIEPREPAVGQQKLFLPRLVAMIDGIRRGRRFELAAQSGDIFQLFNADRGYGKAAIGLLQDKLFGGKAGKCFANRARSGVVSSTQIDEAQTLSRLENADDDVPPQPIHDQFAGAGRRLFKRKVRQIDRQWRSFLGQVSCAKHSYTEDLHAFNDLIGAPVDFRQFPGVGF